MMNSSDMRDDDNGRRTFVIDEREFTYFFFPAHKINAPVLFILHGHSVTVSPCRFRNENWNIVCPMDRFGLNGWGSWYLGEDGDYFWLDAFQKIVSEVRKETSGDLYFWGSSLGGFGAILHGHLNEAHAVYANVPQTVLLDSSYSNNGMKKYFEKIFGNEGSDSIYNDLKKVIKKNTGCTYFLCFNQLERNNYLAEQGLPFISHLNNCGIKFYSEIRPLAIHGKNHSFSETLTLFGKYS